MILEEASINILLVEVLVLSVLGRGCFNLQG